MKNGKVFELSGPGVPQDLVTELIREGASKIVRAAVEEELLLLLQRFSGERMPDGSPRVVRNGYLPEREVQTGVGPVTVQVPRVRDRNGGEGGIRFESKLLPRYLRKTKSIEELVPWLYLKGISTGQMQDALVSLFGESASGFSAATVSRLKEVWEKELKSWQKRDLSNKGYVYFWADGIHLNVRGEENRLCLLVIVGVTESGHKELVAMEDGYRESAESWVSVLRSLKERRLEAGPQLAIGDGALGFWKAIREVYPNAKGQRCWQHKTMNVLDKFPKSMRAKVLNALHDIWQAPTKKAALAAWNRFVSNFKDKYPKAVETLEKDKETLLTYFSFPAAHWKSIRTTNPIESIFASIQLRAYKTKGAVSRATIHAFAFKLACSAQKRFNRLAGFHRLAEVITGVVFTDGLTQEESKALVTEPKAA